MRLFWSIIILGASGCAAADDCHNTVIGEAERSGTRAVLFQRDCGATTGFSTQISLIKTGETLGSTGNTFIADGGRRTGDWGGPWAELKWLSDGRLLVRFDADARIFKQERAVAGAQIVYRSVPAKAP